MGDTHPLCLAGSGKCKIKEAGDLVVGDRISVPTKSGSAEIAGISSRHGLGKYLLETEACTVVANGIRVPTLWRDGRTRRPPNRERRSCSGSSQWIATTMVWSP